MVGLLALALMSIYPEEREESEWLETRNQRPGSYTYLDPLILAMWRSDKNTRKKYFLLKVNKNPFSRVNTGYVYIALFNQKMEMLL